MDFIVDGYNNIDLSKKENREQYETLKVSNVVYINSKDRNYNNDSNYNFSISFTPSLTTNYVGINEAYVNKDFKNIVDIKLEYVLLKNIYVDQKQLVCLSEKGFISSSDSENSNNIRLQRICDLPYLLLVIQNLDNDNISGTNKEMNKTTFTIILDDNFDTTNNNSGNYILNSSDLLEYNNLNNNFIANTDKKRLKYKFLDNCSINYYPGVKHNLKTLKFSLYTPNGILLNNLNDYLELNTFKRDQDAILLTFKSYFCSDEYSLGDTIIFKNVVFETNLNNSSLRKTSLQQFLIRTEGHTIIKHGSASNNLYNSLYIPFDYSLNLLNGTTSTIKDDFGLNDTFDSFNSGVSINLNLENIIVMNIITEKRDNKLLHTNIN